MKDYLAQVLILGLLAAIHGGCGQEDQTNRGMSLSDSPGSVDIQAGGIAWNEWGISRWHIRRTADSSVLVEGLTASNRHGIRMRLILRDPSGSIIITNLDNNTQEMELTPQTAAGDSEFAGVVNAFRADVNTAQAARSQIEVTGLTGFPGCGSHDGICTTRLWGNGRTDYSCSYGLVTSFPTFCISDDWAFSYPWADSCTGSKGTGFCLW